VDLTSELDLGELTCSQLRRLCRDRALKVKGLKNDLVGRIARHEKRLQRAERKAAEEEAGELTDSDKFVASLSNDSFDESSLEEIFNIEMPQPGEIVSGIVVSLVDWGAFVELDESGWTGLLHVSEIAEEFIDNIEDYLHPGQRLECIVIRNQNDRLDRLSLSMRRLADKVPKRGGVAGLVAEPASPVSSAVTVKGKKIEAMEDAVERLEIRMSAIEAVLSQLGHGQALRSAQEEAHDGTRLPSVPPMDVLLSGIPNPGEQRKMSRNEFERDQIDDILRDLKPEND